MRNDMIGICTENEGDYRVVLPESYQSQKGTLNKAKKVPVGQIFSKRRARSILYNE